MATSRIERLVATADEIKRSTPKTQSALLERQVTSNGHMPRPDDLARLLKSVAVL
ncbi:MAG: AAA family ATPase [Proteobacteria bacterium]|jgi:MoxR-like ATPase|nr:AAA family ATPase [Betaproteobacteria bacterium]MCL1859999.1 AAA family ATPase [Pseudomonadota bacterium]